MGGKYRVVDVFAGAGGFSRGFADIGMDIAAAVEVDWNAARSFSANFPGAVVLPRDIGEVDGDYIRRITGHVDVLIGGPPCEAFTPTNPNRMLDPLDRLYLDPLGQLTLHFVRLVGELKPRVFVMENVVDVVAGPLKEALAHEFARVGYTAHFNVLYAEDYGVASARKRVFVSNMVLRPPKTRRVTVGEALEGLPPPDTGFPNHEHVPVSPRKARKIAMLRCSEALVKFRGARETYGNYIKLCPDDIAPTVMGSRRFIHPFEDRPLTVREQARLMGFPDSHVFHGPKDSQFNQVGEAVPPPLARAIATEVARRLADGD